VASPTDDSANCASILLKIGDYANFLLNIWIEIENFTRIKAGK
jgi:hypothetical protein